MIYAGKAPTIIIVHASRFYDRQASAKYGIGRTIDKCRPAMILEIEDIFYSSYLALPAYSRTSAVPGAGVLLDKFLFESRGRWFDTDTFVFVGGRPDKCLANAFLSTFLLKAYDPDSIFRDLACWQMRNFSWQQDLFNNLTPRSENSPLYFHFNFEGIYSSTWDFRHFCAGPDPEAINWSPETPWVMMATTINRNRKILERCGFNVRGIVNGIPDRTFIPNTSGGNKRIIYLFYWINTADMAKAIYHS
jgi:hypothetical protein